MDLQDKGAPRRGAAEWDARLRSPRCTPEDRAAFARWCDADPANREAFETLQESIHFARIERHRPEVCAMRDRALGVLHEFAMTRPPQTRRRDWTWSAAVGAAVLVAGLVWGDKLLDSFAAPERFAVETDVSEHREFELDDGSRITLGARSKISVRFDGDARRLWLDRGQAYFAVTRDEQRPFVVQAGGGTITATATGFDVRQIGRQIDVTVIEGSVEVASLDGALQWKPKGATDSRPPAFPATSLQAGERFAYGDVFRPVQAADLKSAVAWRRGYLSYIGEPLRDVIADLQRYSRKQLIIEDASIGELVLSATVFPDSVEDWIAHLPGSLPVEVERPDRRTLVVRAREVDRVERGGQPQ